MRRLLLIAMLITLLAGVSFAQQAGRRFVAIALHDVVDSRQDLDPDAITTVRLVELLEFLKGNGWTAISLDDVEQAANPSRPLPERAILITIDDGYRSAYTRVFPLLLAYRMPAVFAIEGSWMTQTGASRERYISWNEAREMQRSGLIEFASHTYDLHRGIKGNPQGNELPAAAFHRYDPVSGYEDESAYRLRIREDLAKSIDLMKRELGRAPRALVWPYGRYTATGTDIARQTGFTFALSLDSEPADASKPMTVPRYLLDNNFEFKKIINDLSSSNVLPTVQRLVRLDPSTLWTADARETDARLGRAMERVRKLGATSVVIDAALSGADGTLIAAWFPNSSLPVRADVLSRFAWQMHTRAGVTVFGRLPVKAALNTLKDPERVVALFRDFGVAAPLDGLVLEEVPQLAGLEVQDGTGESPWEVRTRRDAVQYTALGVSDALALRCFRVVEAARPRLSLAVLTNSQTISGPSSIADVTLIATSDHPKEAARLAERLKKLDPPGSVLSRRLGVWIDGPEPPTSSDLIAVTQIFQRNGLSVIGWKDDMNRDMPPAARVARAVSASTFPVRF